MFGNQVLLLSISEGVAAKAVNLNGVEILLRMFYDWHRTDHHNRKIAIRKALLNSLKALVSTSKLSFCPSLGGKPRECLILYVGIKTAIRTVEVELYT